MSARWEDDAACAEIGMGMFLPPDSDDGAQWNSNTYAAGKAVCDRCPVRAPCLEDAMAHEGDLSLHFRTGLYGGLTPNQRVQLARARATGAAA